MDVVLSKERYRRRNSESRPGRKQANCCELLQPQVVLTLSLHLFDHCPCSPGYPKTWIPAAYADPGAVAVTWRNNDLKCTEQSEGFYSRLSNFNIRQSWVKNKLNAWPFLKGMAPALFQSFWIPRHFTTFASFCMLAHAFPCFPILSHAFPLASEMIELKFVFMQCKAQAMPVALAGAHSKPREFL